MRPGIQTSASWGQSPAATGRKHTLSPTLLGLWKATFLERAHTLFQPDEQRDEDQARIAELEQLLGRATRQIEILKTMTRQTARICSISQGGSAQR